jgi:hypothetical protein
MSAAKELASAAGSTARPSHGAADMPWSAKDARKHTKSARTPKAKRQWAHVANGVLESSGSESRAIREANSVIARRKGR